MQENWNLRRYEPADKEIWDEFVGSSRNSTFLFLRGYMDYHSDRFADCSWLAFKGNRLRALLPADIAAGATLRSHGGLSYGGWILPQAHFDGSDMMDLFITGVRQWKRAGIKRLDYKPLPSIYAQRPSQEDLYALFRLGATLSEVSISSTIDLRNPGDLNKLQRRHLAKAEALPIEITESDDVDEFMALLEACLWERHSTTPVHTARELKMLRDRFPENIRIFVTRLDGHVEAGVCIYDTGLVAHAQYIATSPEGRKLNLLTPLFDWLIKVRYSDRSYFDFGISTEDAGRILNVGLLRQKSSYGATATVFSRYILNLDEVLL